MICRFCQNEITQPFLSLGNTPLANSFLDHGQLNQPEPYYPLIVYVCPKCFLVQVPQFESPKTIFEHYVYFSSFSDTWRRHCSEYASKMIAELGLNATSLVVELASNDGCLLECFVTRGIAVLGIEPALNVAEVARSKGIPTETVFFGKTEAEKLAKSGRRADLLVGNNVLAHVPELNDFVAGMKKVLKPGGTITVEFPHLLQLLSHNQFDTIYHEHFSYFSLYTVREIFAMHELEVYDVEELSIHGGSLRIFVRHREDDSRPVSRAVVDLIEREIEAGCRNMRWYDAFAEKVKKAKRDILKFLIQVKEEGGKVAAYGAPAKGNTLLNFCGIGIDFIDFTVDRNPHKQGLFLPGSHIPILPPQAVMDHHPDFLFILPWNLKDEIMLQMQGIRDWGGRFVLPIPELRVL